MALHPSIHSATVTFLCLPHLLPCLRQSLSRWLLSCLAPLAALPLLLHSYSLHWKGTACDWGQGGSVAFSLSWHIQLLTACWLRELGMKVWKRSPCWFLKVLFLVLLVTQLGTPQRGGVDLGWISTLFFPTAPFPLFPFPEYPSSSTSQAPWGRGSHFGWVPSGHLGNVSWRREDSSTLFPCAQICPHDPPSGFS